MNKTISINLGGQVFQIDDNAFEKLKHYLESIRARFATTEGSDEIISDIEGRIAEMFSEKLSDKKQVIVFTDVEEVINIMGRPEEFETEPDEDYAAQESKKKSKRLFRDPDDKVLGGVCSGLSAYLGINDPLWIRILFVVAFFFWGTSFLVYIILWLIVPEAKTASEKLQMRGENINISNIEKTIKEDLNDLKDRINNIDSKEAKTKAKNASERFINLIIAIIVFFVRFVFKLVAFTLVVAGIFIFAICLFLFLLYPIGLAGAIIPPLYPLFLSSKLFAFLSGLALFLLIGIPAVALVYLGFRILLNRRLRIPGLGLSFLGLWIVGVILSFVVLISTAADFSRGESVKGQIALKQPVTDTLFINVNRLTTDDRQYSSLLGFGDFMVHEGKILVQDRITLDVKESATSEYVLEKTVEARGGSKNEAYDRATNIQYNINQTDSALYFDNYFTIDDKERFRGQKVQLVLRVPIGAAVFLSGGSRDIIYDIKNVSNTYDGHMVEHTWMMKPEGLTCLDCEWLVDGKKPVDSGSKQQLLLKDFDEINAEGNFTLQIKKDKDFAVWVYGDDQFVNNLEVDITGNKLNIETSKRFMEWFRDKKHQSRVEISLPSLTKLNVSGANNSTISGFDQDELNIEINGASKSELKIDAKTLNIEINGASEVELTGKGKVMVAEINGASSMDAFDFETSDCTLEVNGASSADVYVTDKLDAEASGASNIVYKGFPSVTPDVSGFSSIKPKR